MSQEFLQKYAGDIAALEDAIQMGMQSQSEQARAQAMDVNNRWTQAKSGLRGQPTLGDALAMVEDTLGKSLASVNNNLRVSLSATNKALKSEDGGDFSRMDFRTIFIITMVLILVVGGIIFILYVLGKLPGIEAPTWFVRTAEDDSDFVPPKKEPFYPSVRDITDQETLGLLDRLNGCHGHANGARPIPSKIEGTVPRFGVGSYDLMDMEKRNDRSTEKFVETNSRYNNRILPRASWVSSM